MNAQALCHRDSLALIQSSGGFSMWSLDTGYPVSDVLAAGFFNKCRDNGLRTGDWLMGNAASADGETFEPMIAVITVGGEARGKNGERCDIEVVLLTRAVISTPELVEAAA